MKFRFYKFALCAIAIFLFSNINSFAQVKSWGYNAYSEIGNGNTTNQTAPVNIGMNQTTGFGGGYLHTLFLQADGTILSVGYNNYGELGDGTTTTTGCFCKTAPVTVLGISTAVQVAGGSDHSMAVLSDGTVMTWGYNLYGALGNGTTIDSSTPVFVTGLTNVTAVQAGAFHSLALKSDGTVWTWGDNNYGQLGNNTTANKLTPVQVSGLTNVVAISSGDYYSIALKADGTVWVWGDNTYGEVGNNTTGTTGVLTPTQTTITGVSQISAGAYHNAALKPDGTVWIWGNNTYGQVGNGTAVGNQLTPAQNTTLTAVIDVTTDGYTNYVRRRDGTVWAWGYNNVGEVGNGTTTAIFPSAVSTPVQTLVAASNAILGAAYYHAFVANPQIITNAGANRTLQGDNVKIKFDNVSAAGTTSYSAFDPTIYTLPTGYTVSANEPAYNVSTTATFDRAEVCIKLNADYDPAILNRLKVLHYESGAFYDRTTTIDLKTRRICSATSALTPFSPFLIAQGPGATAAQVSISGRVTAGGKGIANARVELAGTGGTTRTVTTNSFGNFTISEVEAGATYVVNVSAKRYTFASQVVSTTDNVSDLTFTAQ